MYPRSRISKEDNWAVLMSRAQTGDKDAYTILLRELVQSIKSITRDKLHDPARAEVVTQEIVLALHDARHTYHHSRSFKNWLHSLVDFKLLNLEVQENRAKVSDEEFIHGLAANLKAKRSIATSQFALVGWMLLCFLVMLPSIIVLKIRSDVGQIFEVKTYYLQLFSGLGLAISLAAIALHLRIPAMKLPAKFLAAITPIWIGALMIHGFMVDQVEFVWKHAINCASTILLLSLIPGAVLYFFVRRGRTTEPQQAFAVVGLAMTSVVAAFLPLVCLHDSALHLLAGHASPFFLVGILFWFIGRLALKW